MKPGLPSDTLFAGPILLDDWPGILSTQPCQLLRSLFPSLEGRHGKENLATQYMGSQEMIYQVD